MGFSKWDSNDEERGNSKAKKMVTSLLVHIRAAIYVYLRICIGTAFCGRHQ